MTDDEINMFTIRGVREHGPRWAEFMELNNSGAHLLNAGLLAPAREKLEAAYRLTLVDDVDIEGLDARARALANLAALCELEGRVDESLDMATRAIAYCDEVLDAAGDEWGTRACRVSIQIDRAQTLQKRGRMTEVMAELDAALAQIDGHSDNNNAVLTMLLHNTRTAALMELERWNEAETEARLTLDIVLEHAPQSAGHPYANLAGIKIATGDIETATELLTYAAESHAEAGDLGSHALAIANLARMATLAGDFETALERFAHAEQDFAAAGDEWRLAETKYSRALVQLMTQQLDGLGELLTEVEAFLAPSGNTTALAECRTIIADLSAATGDYAAAEAGYQAAEDIYRELDAGMDIARLDVRRATALLAKTWEGHEHDADEHGREPISEHQYALLREAASRAIPAALATDAMRHHLSPGPDRERWIVLVASPAMATALMLATMLNDLPLVADLIENCAATVSLRTEPGPLNPPDPGQVPLMQTMHAFQSGPLPDGPPGSAGPFAGPTLSAGLTAADTALPFAAGSMLGPSDSGTGFESPRFGLPPRVTTSPDRPSTVDEWIAVAEERYGHPIRSVEEVRAW